MNKQMTLTEFLDWREQSLISGSSLPAQGMKQTMNESKSMSESATQIGGEHYKKLKIQVWDFVIANDLDYFQGSILKYVVRWKDKDWIKDLYKARHFLNKYIETMEAKHPQLTERPDGKEDRKEA
jgi:hypothetical protein